MSWEPTVELIMYSDVPSSRIQWRDMFGVCQYMEGPATALPHWHVWSYYTDMLTAMQEAMAMAKKGGRFAVAFPNEKEMD